MMDECYLMGLKVDVSLCYDLMSLFHESYIFKESFCKFNQLVYDGNNLSASGCLGNFVMS